MSDPIPSGALLAKLAPMITAGLLGSPPGNSTRQQNYGPPRSGTTLFSAMLGSQRNLAVGPETQTFGKLPGAELKSAISDPDWPVRAVKSIAGLTLAGQAVPEVYDLNENDIASYLKQRTPSIQSQASQS